MGDPQELDVRTILELSAAASAIADNEALEGKVAYRIGRLASHADSIVKSFNKKRDILLKNYRADIKGMTDKEAQPLADKLNEELEGMLDITEEIKVPKFHLSEFIAKKDMKVGEREYKEGQMLVPQKFFSLMGEFVIDDKDALKQD